MDPAVAGAALTACLTWLLLPSMRFIPIAVALLLVGCKHPKPDAVDAIPSNTAAAQREANRTHPAHAQEAKLVPVTSILGKVESVNLLGRFVVVDFTLSPMPQLHQRLGVYRHGQKIGEIKITGPARNQTVAADIIAGEAGTGDEVRQ